MLKYFFCFACISLPAQAVSLDSYYYLLEADQEAITIEATNPDASAAHVVALEVMPIDSPFAMKPLEVAPGEEGHLLFTPVKSILPASGKAKYKFIYNGPADGKERYYAISWHDSRLERTSASSGDSPSGRVSAIVTLQTALVIKPRQENRSYHWNGKRLLNNGNSTFRFYASGKCAKNTEAGCEIYKPVMPGKEIQVTETLDVADPNMIMGIWKDKSFLPFGREVMVD